MLTAPTPSLPWRTTISLPRVYSTLTEMGAEYVMSRRRHCCGVMLLVM